MGEILSGLLTNYYETVSMILFGIGFTVLLFDKNLLKKIMGLNIMEKPLMCVSAQAEICQVFRFALCDFPRKYSVKHKHGHGKRQNVQNGAQRRIWNKDGWNCKCEINDEQSAGKRVSTVSSFEKSGDFLLHGIIPFIVR